MVVVEEKWCIKCKKKVPGKFCTDCGTELQLVPKWCRKCKIESSGKFCSECGDKLVSLEEVATAEPGIWCPTCKVDRKGKFCIDCGGLLEHFDPLKEDAQQTSGNSVESMAVDEKVSSTCTVPEKMEVDGEDTVNSTAVTKDDVPDEKEVNKLNKEMNGGQERQKSAEEPADCASTHVKLAENREEGGESETLFSLVDDENSRLSTVVLLKLGQNDNKKSSDNVESILRDEVIKSPNDNTKTSEKSSSVKPNESPISSPAVVSAEQIPLKEKKDSVSTSKDETVKSLPACDANKENISTSSEVSHKKIEGMSKLANIQQKNEISETAENQKSGEKNTTTKNVVPSTCSVPDKMEVDGEDTVNSTAVTKNDVPDEKEVSKLNKEMDGGKTRQKSTEKPVDHASTHVKLAENKEQGGENETSLSSIDEDSKSSFVVVSKLSQNDDKKSSDKVESISRDEVIKSPNDNAKTSEKSSSVKPNESSISTPVVVSAKQIPLKEEKDTVSTSKDETFKSSPACDSSKENTSSEVTHNEHDGMPKLVNIQQRNEISETAENQKSGEKNTTTKNVVSSTCTVPEKMEVDGEDTVNSTAVTKDDVPDEKEVNKLNKEMNGGQKRQKSAEEPADCASTHVKLAENREEGGESETLFSLVDDENSKLSTVVLSKLGQNDNKKSSDNVESILRDEVIKSPNDNTKTSEKSSSVKPNESPISSPAVVSVEQIPLKEKKDTVSTLKDETVNSLPACDANKENTSSEVSHKKIEGMSKLANIQQKNEISETAENQKSGEKNTTTKNVVPSTCSVPDKMEVDGEDTVNSTAVTKNDVPDEKEVSNLNKEMDGGKTRQKSTEKPVDHASTHVKLAENKEQGGENETSLSSIDEDSKSSFVVVSKLSQNDDKKSSDKVESILRDEVIKSPNDNTKTSEKSSSVKPNESSISTPVVVSAKQIPLKEEKDTVSTSKDETFKSSPACDSSKENTSSEVTHNEHDGMPKLVNIQQRNEISETAENQKSGEKNTTTKNVENDKKTLLQLSKQEQKSAINNGKKGGIDELNGDKGSKSSKKLTQEVQVSLPNNGNTGGKRDPYESQKQKKEIPPLPLKGGFEENPMVAEDFQGSGNKVFGEGSHNNAVSAIAKPTYAGATRTDGSGYYTRSKVSDQHSNYQHQYRTDNIPSSQRYPTSHDPMWFKIPPEHLAKENNITIQFFIGVAKDTANYFHNSKCAIFFGSRKLSYWNQPAVEMKVIERGKEFYVLQGELTVPGFYLEAPIDYKYAVLHSSGFFYEILYTATRSGIEGYRNRLLRISSEILKKRTFIYQVDDLILPPVSDESGIFQRWFGSSNVDKMKNFSDRKCSELFSYYVDISAMLFRDNLDRKMYFLIAVYSGFFDSYSRLHDLMLQWEKIKSNTTKESHIKKMKNYLQSNIKAINSSNLHTADKHFYFMNSLSTVAYMEQLVPANQDDFICVLFQSLSLEYIDSGDALFETVTNMFSGTAIELILNGLQRFMKKALYESTEIMPYSHCWCYPLVLIHFLSGECVPYGDPRQKKLTIENVNRQSCGLDSTKQEYLHDRFLDATFKNLTYFKNSLKMDKLLQRSLAFLMKARHYPIGMKSRMFNDRLLMRMMNKYVESSSFRREQVSDLTATIYQLKEIVATDKKESVSERSVLMDTLLDLLIQSAGKIPVIADNMLYYTELVEAAIICYNSILCMVNNHDEDHKKRIDMLKAQINKKLVKIGNVVKDSLIHKSRWHAVGDKAIGKELRIIESFLKIKFDGVENCLELKKTMHEILHDKIKEIYQFQELEFIKVYSNLDITSYLKEIQDVFQEICSTLLDTIAENPNSGKFMEMLSFRKDSYNILCGFFQREWRKNKTFHKKLEHCLVWPPMKSFLNIFSRNKTGDGVDEVISEASSILSSTADQIVDSTISMKLLESLYKKKEIFCSLNTALGNESENTERYQRLLSEFDKRVAEIQSFKEAILVMKYFLYICKELPEGYANMSTLQAQVLAENIQYKPFKEIYDPENSIFTYFQITPELYYTAAELYSKKVLSNGMFNKSWTRVVHDTIQSGEIQLGMTHIQIFDVVVKPVLKTLRNTVTTLVTGEATFRSIMRLFDKSQLDNLQSELNMSKALVGLDYSNGDVSACVSKINCLFQLRECLDTIEQILRVKDKLQLTGDFTTVIHIKTQISSNDKLTLKEINEKIVRDAQLLLQVSPDMIAVFKEVSSCLPILQWLRQNLKDPKEVKVFVEMMSIAAGENDYEVDRVACFEASCIAFSPMIFNLDEQSGFSELYTACKDTADELKNDKTIIDKLIDSNRYVEWFKQAKDAQGSVATKSIMQAKSINRQGRYIIGNIKNNYKRFIEEEATLSEAIQLIVKTDDDKENEYKLEEIHDLQSRLMLLGGDGVSGAADNKNQEKYYFVEMSDVVTRLANVYVSLCEAGAVQWLHYKKEIKCDIEAALESRMESWFKDLKDEITELERHLKEWKLELEEYRKMNPHINYFTVKQCLVLQHNLHPLNKNLALVNKLPPQVFTLLKVLAEDVNVEKIKNAFFLSNIGEKHEENKDWQKVTSPKATNFNQIPYNKISKYLDALQNEHNFDENVSLACLVRCYPFTMSKAIIWCNRQDPDSELIDEIANEAEEELDMLKQNFESSEMVIDEEGTSDEIIAPFLSLKHFGQFLRTLTEESQVKKLKRATPAYLNEDKPSLLILPKDDMLYGVLELYLQHSDSLPYMEEVLLCSDEVSLEQIYLLLLRAVYNSYGLYCLVFADNLGYSSSEKVFVFLKELMAEVAQFSGKMNPLVFVCSSDNENRSYLTSALDAYQVKPPMHHQKDEIHSLLQNQLCLKKEIEKTKECAFAAQVDHQGYNTRVIKSEIGGMGKSLVVADKAAELENLTRNSRKWKSRMRQSVRPETLVVTTPIHGISVEVHDVVDALCVFEEKLDAVFPRIYHFDIAPTVSRGLDCFLFNLIILGYCQACNGKIWRKNKHDLCLIEVTDNVQKKTAAVNHREVKKATHGVMLAMMPTVTCISPEETYKCLVNKGYKRKEWLFNSREFRNSPMQRVYQYLKVFDHSPDAVNNFTFQQNDIRGDHADCLRVLIKYCGIEEPSWMELRNFVHFFNQQLLDSEQSIFTSPIFSHDLRGFKGFVVKFLLEMAKDFSTRSLTDGDVEGSEQNELMVELKRHWEQSSHPYLFFNQDRETLSFLGFNVDAAGNLIDPDQGIVIQANIMSKNLFEDLMRQMERDLVTLTTNYKHLNRSQKLQLLCRVMGLEIVHDPDSTYELTIDNMKKMLAIHMRLRCGIPVILMGETGCGKTRLIRFMCALRAGLTGAINMLLVKVHGGVTAKDIKGRINKAIELAKLNYANHRLSTILFLDEANTTDGIGLIKEIMIDKRVHGKPLALAKCGLEVIAACNPYRRHTENMVSKLESAGLGYHVSAAKTYDKIGHIPLRQLVYRVHPLPESMKPLVWDFGQLNAETEQAYARQIIRRYEQENKLPKNPKFVELLVNVLAASQVYMRQREDECSFVSLRDVERAVQVTSWFYKKIDFLLGLIKKEEFEQDDFLLLHDEIEQSIDKQRRSLVLALGVCYMAQLEDRDSYMAEIQQFFIGEFALINGAQQMKEEIRSCQEIFVKGLKLEDNIACNKALCENVFMMVICVELRIPLFVVGKPGSSKSLAKTIVQDNMQGNLSKSDLFGHFKQIFMSSYQCSPLSTAESIISTFKQCSRFQEGKNLEEYTSVVVLDEVGLAEDSPRMPLKALHPLLEDGTDGSEDLTVDGEELKRKRVAFIGISNWSLDPAKMNRGIMLCRAQPDKKELVNTAKDICGGDPSIKGKIASILTPLAESYLKIYEEQKLCDKLKKYKKEEFFGLRDFYSLIKMVFCHARRNQGVPTLHDFEHSVKRNFSGLEEMDTWSIFKENLLSILPNENSDDQGIVSSLDLIGASFQDCCPCYEVRSQDRSSTNKKRCANARYLLVMTEEYSALPIIEEMFLKDQDNVSVIFGSSFPKDQEFAQICRDINRIKMCMETGRTVVLLNMESLYESLYDALNQYYVYLGGQSYVDLGLGTHRVKCRVHEDFKLIVIADKETVYKSFPIPLINRLEKHYVVTSTCMSAGQKKIVDEIREWAHDFAHVKSSRHTFDETDAFVSFNDDTCASIVIHLAQTNYDDWDEIYEKGKEVLLQLATPDALARLSKSKLVDEQTDLWKTYFKKQDHSSLQTFLQSYFEKNICAECSFVQVTTFSRLLSPDDRNNLQLDDINVQMISLMQFQTEQSFREAINSFFNNQSNQRSLLIIQCSNSAEYSNLVACAQHICKEIKADSRNENGAVCILFLLQLNHTQGGFKTFSGSQSLWSCIHIDELREAMESSPSLIKYAGHSISSLFTFNREHVDLQNSEVVSIVRGCVQAAMRELNEVKHMSTEEIREKIKILSDLLDLKEDISYAFIETFMKVVNDCLCEKESMSLPEEINWVQQEAVEQRHQPDYGTFREALIRCVEDKITPILTVMLNEIDQCNNLMIIKNEPAYKGMWINLLKIFIRVNPENIRNISERVNMFSSRFPFSSQIIHTVDQIIKTHVNKESSEYNLTQIEHAVDAHGIDNILRDLHIGEIQDYIHDLVHSKFSFPAESGFEVLRMSLLIGALIVSKQAFQGTNEDRLPNDGLGIVCVHVALYMFEERFENAVAILNFNPSIAATVLEKIDIDDKEVKVDALALRETLLGLVPNNDELSSQQAEFIWISGVKDIKLLTKAIFHHERACRNRYGIDSKRIMHHSKLLWTKLRILQLYIDNVCPPGVSSRPHERDSIMALWNLIENIDDDMRSIGSWNLIERFIRLALSENENRDNVGDNECVICDEELKDPVTLLCHHTCCYNCTARWLTQSRTCPVCHCLVPDEFNLPTDQLIRKDNYKCGEFKKRCLTFFVEIVTEFCFSRDNIQDVEEDVIKKIMSYAFTSSKDKLTKEFSPVQEYALDPTPVIRSFILQQLLKREECVENYIEECLSTNLKLAESDKDKWNICKLFIHCYEDHLSAVASILKSQTVLSSQYINHIISTLENVLNYFKEKPVHNAISVELLKNVALARLGIIGASSMLCKKYLSKEETADTQTSQELKKLFALLMKFIMNARNTDGHMFLLRQIIRCHGSRELQMAIQKSQFDWLGLKMDDDDSDLVSALESDKYLVHGKGYQEQRDQLSEAIMQESDEGGFESLKQHLAEKNQYDTFIQLAVLRECALSFFDVNSKVSASIEKVFNLQDCFVKMNVARGIINDDVLLELLYHLMVLLERCNTQGLMSLYVTIVNNPQLVQNFYLPTMPSDNFAEVASARPADGSGWVLHRCPRGHAYVITECGRPYTRSRCPECNEGIGGANHQADPGNVVVQNRDLTQPGHSLGSPQQRLNYAVPERHLLPLSVSIQRFLVHLSMLLSSLNGHQQVIHTMITPRIQPDQVIEYLCSHIEQDLKILAQVLGKSSEDVNIITHIFLKHVTEINDVAHNLNELAGKAGRDQYELQFHRHFIETFITLMTTKLDAARCILIGDMRIGANPLMRKLYELDELDIPDFHNIELMTCSQFWSYRQPITLEHFKLVVHEKVVATEGKSVKILSSFLQTEALFRLMNDLPGIIELQNILFVHFNYKLDREGANEMSIKEALSTLAAGTCLRDMFSFCRNACVQPFVLQHCVSSIQDTQKKVQRLLRRYFGVWNELSAVLADYGRVKTDPNYHPIKMDLKSKLSYVLCARDGPGLCAMALIDFLAFNQNEFLELCLKISGMQREIREVSLLKLKGNDIISYKPDRDLLPLVYAHCDYSLEIGRGTKVEYNLAAIEKRLIENVFFGRARIIIQIEEFMYRDDVKSSKRFNNFNQAVQQTSIPHQEQHKMMVELTEIADISNALRAVEIAIGMLTTTKGDPNMLYKRYLTDVLQMDADEYIGSAKMQNTIRLTHLASTWTMLIVERAKRQHANNKEPFEVEDTFSVNIEDDMKPGLNNYLRHVDTRVLLSLLTEYIVSELQYRNENDADFPLSDTLEMFEDTKGVKEEDRCEKIPDEIELKHIYMFWKLVADVK